MFLIMMMMTKSKRIRIAMMITLLSQDKKSRKEQKKSGRNKKLSRLFASDCEDELQSVVSDNPNLYNRSISMVHIIIV